MAGRVGSLGTGDVGLGVDGIPPRLIIEGEACVKDDQVRIVPVSAQGIDVDQGPVVHGEIIAVRFVPIVEG